MHEDSSVIHSVHFYESPIALVQLLCGISSSGLRSGNSVLIVATAAHRLQLVKELKESGVDVRSMARERRFVMFDANEMISTFMVDGMPDADLFHHYVGEIVTEAKKRALTKHQGLTVFGEMVGVLWDQGQREAALQLEGLWNDALNDRAFHLHCAYPRSAFAGDGRDPAIDSICFSHSHVLVA
jgi:hypothetical protein